MKPQNNKILSWDSKSEELAFGVPWYKKKGNRQIIKIFLTNTILALGALLVLAPLLWMVSTSLKTYGEIFKYPPQWLPTKFIWENYVKALTYVPFHRFFFNTMIIIFCVVLGGIFSNMVTGYTFARLRFWGKNIMFMIMLATMMIPYQVTMIPLYIVFTKMGMVDTFLPLILPSIFATPFFTFLVRQYVMTIPYELDEAARIDGCNTWQILFKILFPICKPVITMIVVFSFLWTWNDFLGPLIYLNSEEKYTISLGLSMFKNKFYTEWNLMMAASVVATLPPLLIYYFAQDYIIGGIASMGLKS